MSDMLEVYYGDLCLTDYPYSIIFDGLDYGSPQTVVETLQSLLIDGDVEVSTRSGNRAMTLPVLVEGSDFDALAENGDALAVEADKERNLLTINPGDGFGAATVFETFRVAELPYDRTEAMEGARLRRYDIPIKARPFGRSVVEVTATPTATSLGTARQRLHMAAEVKGSARTEGTVTVEHASTPLGRTLVYVWSGWEDYHPALRGAGLRVGGGGETADASLISGTREAALSQFEHPIHDLPPGLYAVLAWVRSNTGSGTLAEYTITAAASSFPGGEAETTVELPGTTWTLVTIGALEMPAFAASPAATSVVQAINVSGSNIQIDEVYILNLDIGQLTVVEPKGDHQYVEVSPPPMGESREVPPVLLSGVETDATDAVFVEDVTSWGTPVLTPPSVNILTVTAGTTTAVTKYRYTPAWLGHARQL